MLTIYLCFLAGGAVLPFLSFISGFFSDGMDADVSHDIDVDTEIDIDSYSGSDSDTMIDHQSDLDTDMNEASGTDSLVSIALLPTSLSSISAMAITFGAFGTVMTLSNHRSLSTFILALLLGYLVSVMVQTIIKSLKKIQSRNTGVDENELLLYDGKIIDTILPGQLGTVSFVTLNNTLVSYPARCDDNSMKLTAGRTVKVKEFKNGVFIVEPKNKYE